MASPEGLTRKGSEVTVRSTFPSSAVCAGLLGDRARQGEEQRMQRLGRGGARVRRASDMQGEIPESAWRQSEDARKSMQKVRLRP